MAKKNARTAPTTDHDALELELHEEDPAPDVQTTKRPKPRAPTARGSVTPFGTMPHGTTHFRVRRVNSDGTEEVLSGPSSEGGIDVRRWPIGELDADRVASWFGPGTYRVQFMGPTDKGACAHKGWGEYVTINAPATAPATHAPAPATVAATPAGSLSEGLQLFAFIQQASATQTQQTIAMATAMMQAARPAPSEQSDSVLAQLVRRQQQQIDELVSELRTRGTSSRADEDDEDDDEDEDDDNEPSEGGPFAPGVDAADAAKAAALNKLWEMAPDALERLVSFVMTQSSQSNGAPPAPSANVPSSTMETGHGRPIV